MNYYTVKRGLYLTLFFSLIATGLLAQTYEDPIKYFDNGKVQSAWIKKGKKRKSVAIGLKIYYENGQVEREILSGDGTRFFANTTSIRKEYYPNGNLKAMGGAYNIVLCETNEWNYYYEDGTLESKGSYEGGAKVGIWHHYYPTGQLRQEGAFKSKEYNSGDICERKVNLLDDRAMSYLLGALGDREQINFLRVANSEKIGISAFGVFGCSNETGEWKYYDEYGELTRTQNY